MDLVVWMESDELAMDLLRASDGFCACYFTIMLEGPTRIWFKNLPNNFVTSWTDLKEKFIKNFQGTCKRATTIVDCRVGQLSSLVTPSGRLMQIVANFP